MVGGIDSQGHIINKLPPSFMVPQGQEDENANEVMGLTKVKNMVTLEMDGLSIGSLEGKAQEKH
jgi:hypothetical protein